MPISAVSVGVGLLRVLRLITSPRVNNAILRSTMIGHPHWGVEARKRSMTTLREQMEATNVKHRAIRQAQIAGQLEQEIQGLIDTFRNGNRTDVVAAVVKAYPANGAYMAVRIARELGINNRRASATDDANVFLAMLEKKAMEELQSV